MWCGIVGSNTYISLDQVIWSKVQAFLNYNSQIKICFGTSSIVFIVPIPSSIIQQFPNYSPTLLTHCTALNYVIFFLPSAHQNGRWPGKAAEIDPSLCASGRHTFIPFHSTTHISPIKCSFPYFNSFIAGQIQIPDPDGRPYSSFHPSHLFDPKQRHQFHLIIDHPIRF